PSPRLVGNPVPQTPEGAAAVVEALPAAARPAGGEALEVLRAAVGVHVVLARHVERALDAGGPEPLAGDVERAGLLRVGDVAGVDQERGLRVERPDAGDRRLEGGH